LIDSYVDLGPFQEESEEEEKVKHAISFIINCYLVAVGFRPLFIDDSLSHDRKFIDTLIPESQSLFPTLLFEYKGSFLYVHQSILEIKYHTSKELGALLNYIDPIDVNLPPENKKRINFYFHYKGLTDIDLMTYVIRGTTQIDTITNKILQLNLLLDPFNIIIEFRVSFRS